MSKKINRNDPCPCGSGKKYKQCCLKKEAVSKTYTPSGKRKFKAKVLGNPTEKAGGLLGRMSTSKLDSGDLEKLKFKMTGQSFEQEVEPSEEEGKEVKTPKFKKMPSKKPGDDFRATDHDFEVDKK